MMTRCCWAFTVSILFFLVAGNSKANDDCEWCQEYSGSCADAAETFISGTAATARSAFSSASYGSFCGMADRDLCDEPCNNVDQVCLVRCRCHL